MLPKPMQGLFDRKSRISPPYFHVFVVLPQGNQRLLLADLTETDLYCQFLKRYMRGDTIVLDGERFDLKDFSATKVVRTDSTKEETLRAEFNRQIDETERFNASNDAVFLMGPLGISDYDLLHLGRDVTADVITAPPGEPTWLAKLLTNPWTVMIASVGLTVIATAMFVGG